MLSEINQPEVTNNQVPANRIPQEMKFHVGTKLDDIEKVVILETLRQQGNNRRRAAAVLGIGIRTLQRRLKVYNVQLS